MELVTLKLLNVLWYLTLLGSALVFVRVNIQDYLEGSTTYSTKYQSLDVRDLPTLTLCWLHSEDPLKPYIYEKDLTMEVLVIENEAKTVTL